MLALIGMAGGTSLLRGQPRIDVRGDTLVDLGTAYRDETMHGECTILNAGNENLVIEQVSSSCGCTKGDLVSSIIPPHDSTTLRLHFNTSNFLGKVSRFVILVSNDYAHRNFFPSNHDTHRTERG